MLSIDDVKKIALLARIGIRDDEIEKYQHDLSTVLDWFQELQKVDTKEGESMGNIPGQGNMVAEDIVSSPDPAEQARIIENMPHTKDGYTKVRSVF